MNSHKILKIIALVLSLIGTVFALVIMAGDESTATSMSGNILFVSYIVFAIVLALVMVFVVKGVLSGDIKKTLMTLGVFFAIVILSYIISSGTDLDLKPFTDNGIEVTETTSKMVGAGLYAFYVLSIMAVGSMLFGGVKKHFNK